MNRRRAVAILSLATTFCAGWPRLAAAGVRRDADCDDERHCDRPITASTGRAEAGRDCAGRTFARVDHDPPHPPRLTGRREHDHPIERVRARGEGRIKATGDKGALPEMRNKRRREK